MNKRVLAVYNTCGLGGTENSDYYLEAIISVMKQDYPVDIVVSDCMNSENVRRRLKMYFGDEVAYNFIDEKLPLNVTFNATVLRHPGYDAYLYLDSGIKFDYGPDTISKMVGALELPYVLVSALVDTDGGYSMWGIKPSLTDRTDIPLGSCVNLHCQLFSAEFYSCWGGRLLPDIFQSDCSESVMSFLCAAMDRRWCLAPAVVSHAHSLDGGSSGFVRGSGWLCRLWRTDRTILELCRTGAPLGFGFEEALGVLCHKPGKFSASGCALDERLKPWLLENLFTDFDYGSIKGRYDAAR